METKQGNRNNIFTPSRFGAYLRLHARVNRQQLLGGCALIFIWCAVYIAFWHGIFNDWSVYRIADSTWYEGGTDPMWNHLASKIESVTILAALLGASLMFTSMKKKSNRLTTLVLPASNLEKYLAYFALYIVLPLAVTFASLWLTDVMRVAWLKLFTPYGNMAQVMGAKQWIWLNGSRTTENMIALSVLYSALLVSQALFALGSELWKKMSFIKTCGALFAVGLAIVVTCAMLEDKLCPYGASLPTEGSEPTRATAWAILGAGAALSLLIYWLTYARFKEDEIINRW